jgi:hypothetical protein
MCVFTPCATRKSRVLCAFGLAAWVRAAHTLHTASARCRVVKSVGCMSDPRRLVRVAGRSCGRPSIPTAPSSTRTAPRSRSPPPPDLRAPSALIQNCFAVGPPPPEPTLPARRAASRVHRSGQAFSQELLSLTRENHSTMLSFEEFAPRYPLPRPACPALLPPKCAGRQIALSRSQ